MLNYLLLLILIIFTGFSRSSVYQQCKWSDGDLADRAIALNQDFLEADDISHLDIQNNCSNKSYNQNQSLYLLASQFTNENLPPLFLGGEISPLCFLASTARRAANTSPPNAGNRRRYYHCNSINDINPRNSVALKNPQTNRTSHVYLRNPCISEDYLSSLVKTFNKTAYCFDLSPQEVRQIFSIINHESQFTLNAQSNSGARCAGQLTKANVQTSNKQILQNTQPTSRIYQEASSRCPSLKDKTIPNDILCEKPYPNKNKPCPHEDLRTTADKYILGKLGKYPLTCKLTTDLPRCLFYSFLFFKKTSKEFDDNFQDNESGLNLNEVVVAEKKVPLISDMEHFKWFTLQLSYNGGDSIARTQIENFLDFFKSQISQANCKQKNPRQLASNNNKYCDYKRQLMSGQSLNMDSVKKEFTDYLKQAVNEKGVRMYNRDEIYKYPGKVQRDINYFQNSEGVLRDHLEKLAKRHLLSGTNQYKYNRISLDSETRQKVQDTVNAIKDQCQLELP